MLSSAPPAHDGDLTQGRTDEDAGRQDIGLLRDTALRCTEYAYRQVSGLISGVNLNHHLPMQKNTVAQDDSLLKYRCGGSVGLGLL